MKQPYKVILFYKFAKIKNPQKWCEAERAICERLKLKGRMLVATEGVNATFEGTNAAIQKYKRALHQKRGFEDVVFKESAGTGKAFTRLEIKVRPEIVTLGSGEFDIKKETAKNITAAELEALYRKDEDFVVLDLRNDFEIKAGYFEKTLDPGLKNFRDLPQKIKELKNLKIENKKVVAVCTGGIRCEKATCLLKREGFKNLYQLKDGIHTYMQRYPGQHFKGTLFVFDNRMTTPVVDFKGREIVGRCFYCNKKCEDFYSNDSVRPSQKLIACRGCFRRHQDVLRSCQPS